MISFIMIIHTCFLLYLRKKKCLHYYETVFFYRGDRRSENLRVHTLIQGLLKMHVLLLRLAKYGNARAPCAPPIPQSQNEPNQYNPIELAIWMVLYLHIPVQFAIMLDFQFWICNKTQFFLKQHSFFFAFMHGPGMMLGLKFWGGA